jgi:hypothetical protein
LTGWFVWNWARPVTYSWGGNVFIENNMVYYGNQQVATVEEFAQQAAELATSAPEVEADEVEWMALGVFALVNMEGGDPTMFIQLAVSREGIIAGTYQNTQTDTTQSLEGMVDSETQRAAWRVVDQDWPVMETGINNLLEEETPVLVHFADGQTQQWLLVALDEPDAAETDAEEAPAATSE